MAADELVEALRMSEGILEMRSIAPRRLKVLVEVDALRPVNETLERAYNRWEELSSERTSVDLTGTVDGQTRAFESRDSGFSITVLEPG